MKFYNLPSLKIAYIAVAFLFKWSVVSSQTLTVNKTFFDEHLKEYRLSIQPKLGGFLTVDSISIGRKRLKLYIGSTYKNLDSLNAAWCALTDKYDEHDPNAFAVAIFRSFAFQMELPESAVTVQFFHEKKYFHANINYDVKSQKVRVDQMMPPRITRGDREFSIPISQFLSIRKTTSIGPARKNDVKLLIKNYLTGHFAATSKRKPELKWLKDRDDLLSLEVSNISKEILTDIGYFELIRINIEMTEVEKEIRISCSVLGKYGSGIFKGPRKTDYKNIEPQYSVYLSDYEDILENDIKKALGNR